jgi:hypothetical protein
VHHTTIPALALGIALASACGQSATSGTGAQPGDAGSEASADGPSSADSPEDSPGNLSDGSSSDVAVDAESVGGDAADGDHLELEAVTSEDLDAGTGRRRIAWCLRNGIPLQLPGLTPPDPSGQRAT